MNSRKRMNTPSRKIVLWAWLIAITPGSVRAGLPEGYYESVDASTPTTLRATLHEIIDDHTRIRYTSPSQTDTWDVLELAHEIPKDGRISQDYFEKNIPIVNKRLSVAGVRLAALLNDIFDKGG